MAHLELIHECFEATLKDFKEGCGTRCKKSCLGCTCCFQTEALAQHSVELDQDIESYLDNNKLNACTYTSVYLDMVHDFGAPG